MNTELEQISLDMAISAGYNTKLPQALSIVLIAKVIEWTMVIIKHECGSLPFSVAKNPSLTDKIILKWFIKKIIRHHELSIVYRQYAFNAMLNYTKKIEESKYNEILSKINITGYNIQDIKGS